MVHVLDVILSFLNGCSEGSDLKIKTLDPSQDFSQLVQ